MQIEVEAAKDWRRTAEGSPGGVAPAGELPDVTAPDGGSVFRAAQAEFEELRLAPAGAPDRGSSPLDRVAGYFEGREARLARTMRAAVERRDTVALLDETLKAQDLAVEVDLGSKVVAKAVSALGQLTSMS